MVEDLLLQPQTSAKADAARPAIHDAATLTAWLVDVALPTWAGTGVDRANGGFFEKIDLDGVPVEEPRRTRVVARQIYVFATAARRRWLADADPLVDHGLDFLLRRMRLPDGRFAASVHADGTVANGAFDLYEHAFVLLALATAARGRPDSASRLHDEADALLARMRSRWGHPGAGFEEATPRTLPLRSNPHMHLLEAALAWADIASGPWDALVVELVDLCLDRFIDPRSGALYECFDGDWRPMPGPGGRTVEPGHQFEWAWLLQRCAKRSSHRPMTSAATRLLEIGETCGVDAGRGVAVDTLDEALAVTGPTAKLWPQTERIKAWSGAGGPGRSTTSSLADRKVSEAIRGLSRYLLASPQGLWHEQMDARGGFVAQHCRASSLYHIVCAVDTLAGPDAVPVELDRAQSAS